MDFDEVLTVFWRYKIDGFALAIDDQVTTAGVCQDQHCIQLRINSTGSTINQVTLTFCGSEHKVVDAAHSHC